MQLQTSYWTACDNVYFWVTGTLKGFTKNCLRFVSRKLDGLPKHLELLFAGWDPVPRTETNALYTHTYAEGTGMLTITQDKSRLTRSTIPSPSKPGRYPHSGRHERRIQSTEADGIWPGLQRETRRDAPLSGWG